MVGGDEVGREGGGCSRMTPAGGLDREPTDETVSERSRPAGGWMHAGPCDALTSPMEVDLPCVDGS